MPIPNVIRQHKAVTALVVVILAPVLAFTIWTVVALNYSYSAGTRAGFMQKISKRGWLCKTWEGDLQVVAIPGAVPEVFHFTVRSDSIAGTLDQLAGKQVSVSYEQHTGLPGSCFGDTEYFVTAVRPVGAP